MVTCVTKLLQLIECKYLANPGFSLDFTREGFLSLIVRKTGVAKMRDHAIHDNTLPGSPGIRQNWVLISRDSV